MQWASLSVATGLLLSADEVIRKRLLVDGEGVSNDDRRINALAKMVIKWMSTKDSAEEDRCVRAMCVVVHTLMCL